jgi:glycerol-3-phosphate dehydrogenase
VRPLFEVGGGRDSGLSTLTRDYAFEIDHHHGRCPLLTVFGGKLTTHRKLAERGLDLLQPLQPMPRPCRTATEKLPGGEAIDVAREYPWLPPGLAARYQRTYGSRTRDLLAAGRDLGRHLGGGLYEREVAFLRDTEWAETVDDIITRRTKLILALKPREIEALARLL